jgi:biopolymer transport protein ExbD
MAEQRRFLDVWIVESNTVYKEVPFTVVADWVQQGRLLEDDQVKRSGTAEWTRIGGSPDFAPYLPRPEPMRPDDQAEALEPVQLDFAYKRRHEDEDDDVDMIPLIDVSLVLLIFFMMTAAAVAASSGIATPVIQWGSTVTSDVTIGVTFDEGAPDRAFYTLGVGKDHQGEVPAEETFRSQQELLNRLDALLATGSGVRVTINAHQDLPFGVVRQLMVELRQGDRRDKIRKIFTGGREQESQ